MSWLGYILNFVSERWNNRTKHLIKTVKEDTSKTKDHVKELKDDMRNLRTNFNSFVADSMSGNLKQASEYILTNSPAFLSPKGDILAEESGITNYIEARREDYTKQMEDHEGIIDSLSFCRTIAITEFDHRNEDLNQIIKYFVKEGISGFIMREIFALKLEELLFPDNKSKNDTK